MQKKKISRSFFLLGIADPAQFCTCHWCHVMAHESFEEESVAEVLNRGFVSIKVDREQRPDIDGVYLRVCQSMTGSGGWPASIFMDAEGRPFFAGTYFPRHAFIRLLDSIIDAWHTDREQLLQAGKQVTAQLRHAQTVGSPERYAPISGAVDSFRNSFDPEYGGFGGAPKFPSPHNLMFLLKTAPELAEKTLVCMYRGGIFDHIGGGFSRYSTDRYWLVPHFEKMLYDNALLAMAYLLAYEVTGKALYRAVATWVFDYLECELRQPNGGFSAAQDADSDGVEGKYYLLTHEEILRLLGQEHGKAFCRRYAITPEGNFEGKSVPNLLQGEQKEASKAVLSQVYAYRKKRAVLNTDRKQLAAWNALAAAAYAMAGRILKEEKYLKLAQKTLDFLERELMDGKELFVCVTDGQRGGPGFLDDYALYIFALIQMHQATMYDQYLHRASVFLKFVCERFWDKPNGGFFFSGKDYESLIARPKETWDGAMPSGNSVMAYNLSRMALLTDDEWYQTLSEQQRRFMNGQACSYPMGYGFYLWSALPVKKIICVPDVPEDLHVRSDWVVQSTVSSAYPQVDGKTTFYVCEDGRCLPPSNQL